jgi:hypothetical protein
MKAEPANMISQLTHRKNLAIGAGGELITEDGFLEAQKIIAGLTRKWQLSNHDGTTAPRETLSR